MEEYSDVIQVFEAVYSFSELKSIYAIIANLFL